MNKEFVYKSFGRKLKDARKNAGLTQVDLAERVGLSRTSITNIEKGRQGIPLHLFLQIASAVGVKPIVLLPDKSKSDEQDLVDRKLFKETYVEEDGVGWAERVISSVLKEGG